MQCPRCSYEWDVRQGPCPRCNLYLHVPGFRGSTKPQAPVKASPLDRSVPSPSTGGLNPNRVISSLPGASALRLSSSVGLGEQAEMQPLLPGTLLHRDRYSLQKKLHKREWPLGIVEVIWAAFDTRFAKSPVVIYELSLPHDLPKEVQAIPYTATKVFTSIGRNAHILPLRDVFGEQGRSFFVFESVDGLPLVRLLFNNDGKLPEAEVITCCLQMVELLDVCSQQSPPLIHGNIRPEYIVKRSTDSQYVLTNFSVALAGGLAQIVTAMESVSASVHNPHMQMREKMDGRSDLYALLATAHYAVTGYWLSDTGMEANSSSMVGAGSVLSSQLRVLLLKGLRVPLHQRYQKPSELYQDLLVLHLGYETQSSPKRSFAPTRQATMSTSTDAIVSGQSRDASLESRTLLVPLQEELPPLKEVNDLRNAVWWFVGMLMCLVLLLPGLF
jgi:hypothetical protein